MLQLEHPDFEIIVANDGSTDGTLDVLTGAFGLAEVPVGHDQPIRTAPVHRMFRSSRYPKLVVVDKAGGGRADAINAALNVARHPLVCVVEATAVLDGQALIRASRPFVADDAVVAVGGTVRPLNGAVVRDGTVSEPRAPRRWVERAQVLEHALRFFAYRATSSRLGMLGVTGGAFGVFRRSAVIEVGGWRTGTVAEDLDMSVRLHQLYRDAGRPYRIAFTPDTVCWIQVPSTIRGRLRRERGQARALVDVLWRHRRTLFNRRYGRIGLASVPYQWAAEIGGPIVEVIGYATLVGSWAAGALDPAFAAAFGGLVIGFRILQSQLAAATESLLLARYPRSADRLALFAAAFVEHLGLHQLVQLARVAALVGGGARGGWWDDDRERYVGGGAVVHRGRSGEAPVAGTKVA